MLVVLVLPSAGARAIVFPWDYPRPPGVWIKIISLPP